MKMEIAIKAFLQRADASVELRRFSLGVENQSNFSGAFKALKEKVKQYFPDLSNKTITLAWKDSDEDFIVMSTDEELMEAFNQSKGSPLKVYVTNEGESNKMPENDDDFFTVLDEADTSFPEPPNKENESKNASKKNVADGEEEADDDAIVFMGVNGIPECPPCPPPPFPPFAGFGFHHGGGAPPHNPRHFWKQHFQGMGGHGFRGGPFRGEFGGPVRMRMGGAFRQGPFFMAHHAGMPPFGCGPMGPFGGPRGRRSWGKDCRKRDGSCRRDKRGDGWKNKLRELVPVEHRRWAKTYIRDWRSNHLTNATTTTTSGEENAEKQQETAAGSAQTIPDVYSKWLDRKLPKWHRRWAADKPQDEEEEFDVARKSEFENIKVAVPWEFRKWVKWYLNRHFTPKEAPQFRGCHDREYPTMEGPWKKHWKQTREMLKELVPMEHRKWAKSFIRQWRLERNIGLEDGEMNSSNTESDAAEVEKESKGEKRIPEDYSKWLAMFLIKWHAWRGLITASDNDKNIKLQDMFVDTVPMEFRQWARMFVRHRFGGNQCRKDRHGHGHGPHHGRHHHHHHHHQGRRWERENYQTAASDEETQMMDVDKFHQMLKAFQKQWLTEHQDGTSSASEVDILVIASDSDDNDEDDDFLEDNHVASSFKRLRLEDGATGPNSGDKSVRFQEQVQTGQLPMMQIRSNRRSLEADGQGQGMNFSPQFRRWAKAALWQWDGKTLGEDGDVPNQNDGVDGEQTISPRMYRWMAKIVLKRQKKLMKQEMKETKRMMKNMRKMQKF